MSDISASTPVAPPPPATVQKSEKSRVAFILLGIFLGGLGIHNFYAGYTGRGIAQLLISLLIGWLIFPMLAIGLWVLIEIITVSKDKKGLPFS